MKEKAGISTPDNAMEIEGDEATARDGIDELNGIPHQQPEASSATITMQTTRSEKETQKNNEVNIKTSMPKNPCTQGLLRCSPSSASSSINTAQQA